MIEAVLVVLTKAHPGREDDLDDWYTNIHLRDALRFRGSIAAQRFSRSADQAMDIPAGYDWQFLALYDVFDPARFSQEHWENALTSRMMVTTAIDDSVLEDYHYYPLAFRNPDPEIAHTGGVILEQFDAAPGRDAKLRDWYADSYLPAAARRAGVHSAAFLVFRTYGQMLPTKPQYRYVGIFKLNSPQACQGWRNAPGLVESELVEQGSVLVTYWDRLTGKLTKDHVQHPDAAGLAAEEKARARMGTDVMTGGAEKLGNA